MKVCGREVKVQGRLVRIGRLDGDEYGLVEPERAIDGIRRLPYCVDLFTFMQILPHTTQNYDYPVVWDNLAALPVSTFEDWWTRQIDGKTRNMVRRAEKRGVVCREVPFDAALVRGIHRIYNEAGLRQGKPFAHRGKGLAVVGQMSSTFLDRSVFLGAFCAEELIGFAKLIRDEESRQASLMHIVSMQTQRDKAPTNALIAEAVRACAHRGIAYLVYSKLTYAGKRRDGLAEFKLNNGFRQVDLPRYYVPLTVIGRVALKLGWHMGLASRVPEPFLERARVMRRWWYSRHVRGENGGQ